MLHYVNWKCIEYSCRIWWKLVFCKVPIRLTQSFQDINYLEALPKLNSVHILIYISNKKGGDVMSGGHGAGFALIVVLFILLIIVGAAFVGGGYGGGGY